MSSVILKGFGDGHSQSPAKEMPQEKLSEVKMRSHLLTCFEKKQLTSFPNERRKAREEYLYTFQRRKQNFIYVPASCQRPMVTVVPPAMRWTAGATTRSGLDLYVLYVTIVNYYQNLIVVLVLVYNYLLRTTKTISLMSI